MLSFRRRLPHIETEDTHTLSISEQNTQDMFVFGKQMFPVKMLRHEYVSHADNNTSPHHPTLLYHIHFLPGVHKQL